MKTNRWICDKCGRSRATQFCEKCGSKRPDETNDNQHRMEDLKRVAMHFRKLEQAAHNQNVTYQENGWKVTQTMLEAPERWRRYADVCEWVNDSLFKIMQQTKSKP